MVERHCSPYAQKRGFYVNSTRWRGGTPIAASELVPRKVLLAGIASSLRLPPLIQVLTSALTLARSWGVAFLDISALRISGLAFCHLFLLDSRV
eukprot:3389215-Amphidinium_carterae.2